MKFLWFHLMPYKELPDDFKDKHPSVWVDIHSSLLHASSCQVSRGEQGNLVLDCPLQSFARGPLFAQFHDARSSQGARLSRQAWACWLVAVALTLSLLALQSAPAARSEMSFEEAGRRGAGSP